MGRRMNLLKKHSQQLQFLKSLKGLFLNEDIFSARLKLQNLFKRRLLCFKAIFTSQEEGTCPTTSGVPKDVETNQADSKVTFSDIKYGPIGSTTGGPSPSPSPTPAPTPSSECCTWDGKYCGATSDYCKATASQCADCGGTWCTDCLPPWTTAAPMTV